MIDLPLCKTLEFEFGNQWLTIWFNRPEARNAISDELVHELRCVLDRVKDDFSIRGVVIRGRNQVFCAGGDIKMFKRIASAGSEGREIARSLNVEAAYLTDMIARMPQVVVAVVEGAAMAGGFGIACASDMVISVPDAKFGITEVRIGLVPAQIIPHIINKIGYAKAKTMMLLANQIDGTHAHEIGLADFLAGNSVEIDNVLGYIKKQVNYAAPGALAKTKFLLKDAKHMNVSDYIEIGADVFADCLVSDEGKEGFASFTEKRKPSWANVV